MRCSRRTMTYDRDALLRAVQARSLSRFLRDAWPAIEPGEYVHGWHVDAICQHLEAVTRGEIRRLAIAIPPGTAKSLLTAVFWPAWIWGPAGRPQTRIIATSHSERLTVRDNLRCRRLITSDWFQRRWRLELAGDQNAKTRFELDAGGWRDALPFRSLTGSRADVVVIDDPMTVDQAASDAERESVAATFLESVPTRLADPRRSAIVLIMQRLHHQDPIGIAMARDLGYELLRLPMEYEPDAACQTSIGWRDPRSTPGELLWPARYPPDVCASLRATMGAYAWAGQMQQRPVPREGGLFRRDWLPIVERVPEGRRVAVRRWDIAATVGGGDWTAGVRMSRVDGRYYVEDVVRLRGSAREVEAAMVRCAHQDGRDVAIGLPQDPGAAGKLLIAYHAQALAGYVVRPQRETGSKVQRAEPLAAQAEAGNVSLVRGTWNEALIEQATLFPSSAHDDIVDAMAGAFAMLTTAARPALSMPSG